MAIDLLLCRHGNTFAPGAEVVWVGRRDDVPLVEAGREQARTLGRVLQEHRWRPDAVYCGPLQRTREHAELVGAGVIPVADPRLDELDYGAWSGLGDEAIVARFGRADLEGWRRESRWPQQAGWGGSEAAVRSEVRAFIADLRARHADGSRILAVSSNGRLRYFLTLVPGELARRVQEATFSVRTGHVCRLALEGDRVAIGAWDLAPGDQRLW